ncbi:MAG: hypothetical protein IPN93_15450 [Bacteroidetes bacterium]|nr:hypothetical protein [Bacteroidota bacterium]
MISKPTDNNFYNQINKETEENVEDEEEIGDVKKSKQRFVSLDRKSIKPNNYIGFIQHGEKIIEIYPKIFYKKMERFNLQTKTIGCNIFSFGLNIVTIACSCK